MVFSTACLHFVSHYEVGLDDEGLTSCRGPFTPPDPCVVRIGTADDGNLLARVRVLRCASAPRSTPSVAAGQGRRRPSPVNRWDVTGRREAGLGRAGVSHGPVHLPHPTRTPSAPLLTPPSRLHSYLSTTPPRSSVTSPLNPKRPQLSRSTARPGQNRSTQNTVTFPELNFSQSYAVNSTVMSSLFYN